MALLLGFMLVLLEHLFHQGSGQGCGRASGRGQTRAALGALGGTLGTGPQHRGLPEPLLVL